MATGLAKLSIAAPALAVLSVVGAVSSPAQVTLDGSANPSFKGPAPLEAGNYDLRAELGRRAGPNLFHSFGKFSLRTGERATFSGPDGIERIISRVTGGARSDIDGTIASTIPGADFYFINPAGIAFGPDARLDLQGSFHVSTADELRFADGKVFTARDPDASSFTVAAPEAFGFLGAVPELIEVAESILEVPASESFSLVGGDIIVVGGPRGFIRAEAGTVALAATAGLASHDIDSGELSADQRADITLRDQALVDTSGNAGGRISIRGGHLLVEDDSSVSVDNTGTAPAVGGVEIGADEVELSTGSQVTADVDEGGTGAGGSVRVTARTVEISGGSFLAADTFAGGGAGRVIVEAGVLRIVGAPDGFTGISSDANPGSTGAAGFVEVTVDDLLTNTDGGTISTSSFAEAEPDPTASSGLVTVTARELEIRNGGSILTDTFGAADAGLIIANADQLRIVGAPGQLTGIFSDVNRDSTGAAGFVEVTVDDLLTISDGGTISTSNFAEVEPDPTASPGLVTVTARELEIRNGGSILTDTFGAADAGFVIANADQLRIVGAANRFTGIGSDSNLSSTGSPGFVEVTVDGQLIVSDGGTISTSSFAEPDPALAEPGFVLVTAGGLEIKSGGSIVTSSLGAADAGIITVDADQLRIVGSPGQFTGIFSDAFREGSAGDVTVVVADRLLLDGGSISTESALAGGGEIRLLVGDLIDLHDGEVETSVAGGDDPTAGNVTIDPEILIIDGSRIQANARGAPRGAGGEITIVADNILVPDGDFQALVDRGDIGATGGPAGVDGTIVVSAPEVDLAGGLVVLEGALLDAASQLRERCGARRDVGASSFTGVGRGGLPPSPDGPLSSAYVIDKAAVGEARKPGSRPTVGTAPAHVRLAGLIAPCAPLD